MLCHFLIGVPGAGKSTFAQQFAQLDDYQVISTDIIRQQLYGEEIIQGNWEEIENEVLNQIQQAVSSNIPVIYDATNAKRAWRIDLLRKIEERTGKEHQWLGWYLDLPLNVCKQWNLQRTRQVAQTVIDNMAKSLKDFPPIAAEGFVHVYRITNSDHYNPQYIQENIANLSRCLINRENRTINENSTFHLYSKLLDFERLMHLISLFIKYPKIKLLI